MIINLTENQSYGLTFLEQYQCSTAGNKITFHQELSQADIDAITVHINEMTKAEREAFNVEEKRKADIIAKADAKVESLYSTKKQRKLMSISIKLMDKKLIRNQPLTVDDEALLQSVRDVDAEITAIRDIENAAIANGTLVKDVTF